METAVVLPVLMLLALGVTDLGLFTYANIQLVSSLANAALYASESITAAKNNDGIKDAAFVDRLDVPLAWWNKFTSDYGYDVSNPRVKSKIYDEAAGKKSVEVELSYDYQTRFNYPGLPSKFTIVHKLRVPVTP